MEGRNASSKGRDEAGTTHSRPCTPVTRVWSLSKGEPIQSSRMDRQSGE